MKLRSLLATLLVCWVTATAAADVFSDYQALTEKISYDALTRALERHPERWTKISMKFKYRIDPAGRIHDIQIISAVRNQWAEDTARRVLSELKLPPIPKQMLQKGGRGWNALSHLILAKTESDYRQLMKGWRKPRK